MKVVFELGRILRDRRIRPIKYPLRRDFYPPWAKIFEWNMDYGTIYSGRVVCVLKLTIDKNNFGVRLRAEPDHRIKTRLSYRLSLK